MEAGYSSGGSGKILLKALHILKMYWFKKLLHSNRALVICIHISYITLFNDTLLEVQLVFKTNILFQYKRKNF